MAAGKNNDRKILLELAEELLEKANQRESGKEARSFVERKVSVQ